MTLTGKQADVVDAWVAAHHYIPDLCPGCKRFDSFVGDDLLWFSNKEHGRSSQTALLRFCCEVCASAAPASSAAMPMARTKASLLMAFRYPRAPSQHMRRRLARPSTGDRRRERGEIVGESRLRRSATRAYRSAACQRPSLRMLRRTPGRCSAARRPPTCPRDRSRAPPPPA